VPAGDVMIFPDFALQHRRDGTRWLLEIVGFWTPQCVERKLALLRVARLGNIILCVDEARSCADAKVSASTRVIPPTNRRSGRAAAHRGRTEWLTCSRPSGYMRSYMRPTAKVTVRELKNQTTAILRRVEGGEAVAVTRRGQVIATIGPASGPPPMASDSIYRQLQRQIETRRPGPVSDVARRA
jgi:prevent-host-death family protein